MTNRDTLVTGRKIVLVLKGDIVALEVHCGDVYEARILYEDIDDRFKRGEMVGIHAARKP